MAKTVSVAGWDSVPTSITVHEQREIDMHRLQHERDHWLVVAAEAEQSSDIETMDQALLAAERLEDRLHNLRVQALS